MKLEDEILTKQIEVSHHLTSCESFLQVKKEQHKINSFSRKEFEFYRNSTDDYVTYQNLIRNLENLLRKEKDQITELKKHLDLKTTPWNKECSFFKFLNRCTIKLLEIDQLCNYQISYAHFQTGSNHLRFLDLCGGPGGFVEYLLLIHKWKCQGLGVTFKDDLDYQLNHLHKNVIRSSFVSLTEIYPDLSGDIFDQKTQEKIQFHIQKTMGQVDLILGDGAFEEKEKQESCSRRLQIQEMDYMFQHLAPGGTFVLKFFDITELQTIRLLTLLFFAFSNVQFQKPSLSRKGNSERYLICTGFESEFQKFSYENCLQYIIHNTIQWPIQIHEKKEKFLLFIKTYSFHMIQTWEIQSNHLQALFKMIRKKRLSFPQKKKNHSPTHLPHLLEKIAEFWSKWRFCWYYNLRQQQRCPKYFQIQFLPIHINYRKDKKKMVWEQGIPLYDNWETFIQEDEKYLENIKILFHESYYELFLVCSNQQIYDIKQKEYTKKEKHWIVSILQNYPLHTIVSLKEKTIECIVSLPDYPKLFFYPNQNKEEKEGEEEKKKKEKIWKLFQKNCSWWES